MKRVYYLDDEPEYIQSFETADEVIEWVYRWQSQIAFSTALRDLIETNYYLN